MEYIKHYGITFINCWYGAAIGAGANLAGTAMQVDSQHVLQEDAQKFEMEQAELNRQFQREEREAAQAWNLEMWNKNNEYNSLESQLERAKEAGVSPNAILGGSAGSIASNPVTTSPMSGSKANFPGYAPVDWSGIANIGTNFAEIANKLAAKKELESKTDLNEQQKAWNDATFEDRVRECKERVDNIVESTNKIIADTNKTNKEADKIEVDKQVVEATLPYIADKYQVDLEIAVETSNKIREEINQMRLNGKMTRSLQNQQMQHEKEKTDNVGLQNAILKETKDETIDNAEYESALLKLKKDFCTSWGMPLETPEFAFMWKLNEAGLLEGYLDNVVDEYFSTKGFAEKGAGAIFESGKGISEQAFQILLRGAIMYFGKGKINPKWFGL